MDPSTSSRARQPDMLYFAYGSNLHLAQMAKRCPASIFKGTGTLSGYRWQINERGVANVVPADDSSVEGLVYLVNPRDVRALDRSEGVARGLYQKHLLTVALQPHRQYSEFTSARLAQVLAETPNPSSQPTGPPLQSAAVKLEPNPGGGIHQDGLSSSGLPDQRQPQACRPQDVKALVYVSEGYVTDGSIRDEYIARMHNAVADASALGVSKSFIDKYIVPHLQPKDAATAVLEQAQEEKEESEQPGATNSGKVESGTVDRASGQAKENQEGPREGRFDAVIIGACVLATAGWCSMTLL
ncbi:hypothetical protein ACHAPT_006032 [Fusarium lateritium]